MLRFDPIFDPIFVGADYRVKTKLKVHRVMLKRLSLQGRFSHVGERRDSSAGLVVNDELRQLEVSLPSAAPAVALWCPALT